MNTPDLDPFQNNNTLTLQSYQNKTQAYIDGTPAADDVLKVWIDECLELLPKNAKIFEIGSGFGRDAEYITQKGFDIECSDAVPNFVSLLRTKGYTARTLNVLTDDIDGSYDMVFADAVLLHFTPEEAAIATKKIHAALTDDGIFALRVKRGDGPTWTDAKLGEPRYFYLWQPEDLRQLLHSCGFEWLGFSENHTSHNNADWIGVIARKI